MSYAVAPVTAAALRRNAPDLRRPFRVSGLGVLGPFAFVVAALIVYWSGWTTVSWLFSLQVLLYLIYLACGRFVPTGQLSLKRQVRSSLWLLGFYILMVVISCLGSFGGRGVLAHPWDTVAVVLIALLVYYWGAATGVPAEHLDLGAADDQ
jgi:amino acid transporter